jgi:DNA adenine methylase
MKIPHPIPYQGSKRKLAAQILAFFPPDIYSLIEPFAGSAALTLAAAARGLARRYLINDLNQALMELWGMIIQEPHELAKQYEAVWNAQHGDRREFYDTIRGEFNRTRHPPHLLYLLARCVKAAVRYNANGEFNQSPDNRRMGALPETMREHIFGAASLLKGKTECSSVDFKIAVARATTEDLIYLDPPYQGVCGEGDPRYLKGVRFDEFVEVLETLNARGISYILSYDGRTGTKVHGRPTPGDLNLVRIELAAGRSSQETLLGRAAITYESLYLSPSLTERLRLARSHPKRQTLAFLEAAR